VDGSRYTDYYIVVTSPMYISKMDDNIRKGHYDSLDALSEDVHLMVNNCYLYNGRKVDVAKVGKLVNYVLIMIEIDF